MPSAKRARARRSHVLGGCSTCRRRHVKCDQKRPACRTCRALGVPCEGFSDQVLWLRGDDIEATENGRRGTRRHLYTEQSRLSMSATLGNDLVSGSVDASLAEVDLRSRHPDRSLESDIVIGPFGVLNFTGSASSPQPQPQSETVPRGKDESVTEDSVPAVQSTDLIMPADMSAGMPDASPASIIDSLSNMDDFLHWSDLLSFSPDNLGPPLHPTLSMPNDIPFDLGNENVLLPGALNLLEGSIQLSTPKQTPVELSSLAEDLLKDAQFLLKNFQDNVIPQIMAVPFDNKSPWKILNLPAAVVAFGDSTFLGTESVTHARLANLFGLLACSAISLALKPPTEEIKSTEHWHDIANRTYQQAKDHIQISLQHETNGPKKAKYKDQLMAANILTQYAILSGQQQHARCFLIDAERLLRLRGLSKRRISKKARLLHHVYTWLRIVGESTFVLHDYGLSYSCLEMLGTFTRSQPSSSTGNSSTAVVFSEPNPHLDDFLRLENQNSDSDLNIDEPKDQASGYHDIHLHDSRSFPETLYKQIYGIPETWLSLVSQTTRLANVLATWDIARTSGRKLSLEAWETLQRRAMRLENMICSFNLGRARGGATDLQATCKPHGHMLEALNGALVIFFYRRIRETHPAALQGYVDSVIAALEKCSASLSQSGLVGPGTAWPAFIAGCEALTTERREAIMRWIDNASSICGFTSFTTARYIMTKLWRKQDEYLTANRSTPVPIWVEILKEEQIWPLFC
ncbi:transcriptional regulator family: Fungal Specific TF [Penicillium macrosclerotiorum]|uniref:transcriptional regulator family: Fungal Specific TF n=1 Tax=Penicillium macrosclerotiorum TaxID=303699 RepID=UPI0025484E14|nr:transcriptional regulator family: Fungal Specific TF [Penicillium macrosclerotiorum]KAJ5673781.1 transcriptional regulator family: Fungal Specific TF [Penicillium macrosclerotiorum]